MASITYHGESARISWFGVAFERGKPVDTDKAELIAAAEKNPLFEVDGDGETKSKPRGKGGRKSAKPGASDTDASDAATGDGDDADNDHDQDA